MTMPFYGNRTHCGRKNCPKCNAKSLPMRDRFHAIPPQDSTAAAWSLLDEQTGWVWPDLPSREACERLAELLEPYVDHRRYPAGFEHFDALVKGERTEE